MERVLGIGERSAGRSGSAARMTDEGAAAQRPPRAGERPRRRRPHPARVEPGERLGRARRRPRRRPRARRRARGRRRRPDLPGPGLARVRALPRPRPAGGSTVRAEVPLLLGVSGSVLRGSIDLLVRARRRPPAGDRLQDRPPRRLDPGLPRRPLRDTALDLRARGRRGDRTRPRSRSPMSSSSVPRSRSSPGSTARRWRPAGPGSPARSSGSPPASSPPPRPRPAAGTSAAAARHSAASARGRAGPLSTERRCQDSRSGRPSRSNATSTRSRSKARSGIRRIAAWSGSSVSRVRNASTAEISGPSKVRTLRAKRS